MLKSGFTLVCALLLILLGWLGGAAPIAAHPLSASRSSLSLAAPTSNIAMAGKSLFSFSGTRPTNLGVKDGKLIACPGTPNCVSSQAAASDKEHYIEAIAYTTSPAELMGKLKSVIQGMERTEIINETSDYLYAEFTSKLMGYVDDVEFYLDDAAKVLHVRSGSRLGQSDLGVNRKRVEAIRAQLAN